MARIRATCVLTVAWLSVSSAASSALQAYSAALGRALSGLPLDVSLPGSDPFFATVEAMIATLTLLLALVAGLGVLNTVLLGTRDRVHDLGVFKRSG